MTNELMDKRMDEMELDHVVGGAGYAYFVKRKNGNYDVISSTTKLTDAQARGLAKGVVPTKLGVNKDVIFHTSPDVPPGKLEAVKQRLIKAYNGCTFKTL